MSQYPKSPLMGQMMDQPLLISSIIQHADRHFGSNEIVSHRVEGDIRRYTYRDCHCRARQLANVLAASSGDYAWPLFDENSASSLCYATGNSQGALYSHRSTLLHSYASTMPDSMNVSGHDAVMPVVPMFHVNASGLSYAVPLTGAKMVFPGPGLYGKSLYELFEQ